MNEIEVSINDLININEFNIISSITHAHANVDTNTGNDVIYIYDGGSDGNGEVDGGINIDTNDIVDAGTSDRGVVSNGNGDSDSDGLTEVDSVDSDSLSSDYDMISSLNSMIRLSFGLELENAPTRHVFNINDVPVNHILDFYIDHIDSMLSGNEDLYQFGSDYYDPDSVTVEPSFSEDDMELLPF